MILQRWKSSYTKLELKEKAKANLRWFQLFRPTDKSVFPQVAGHLYGSFFTATVVLGHMNSFKPVFYGSFSEIDGRAQITGFFAWPISSIAMLLALISFLAWQISTPEIIGTFVGIMILLMFSLVWLFCKFMARKQKPILMDYLAWLASPDDMQIQERVR